MIWLWLAILSLLGGILGRMGGSGNYPRSCRTVGVPVVQFILLWILFGLHWESLVVLALSATFVSTYWKREPDAKWYHWYSHGLLTMVAFLPFCYWQQHMAGFAVMCIAVPPIIALLSGGKILKNPFEEFARYAIICSVVGLLKIS